jgi:ubiquitin-like protein Nedd8
MVFHISPSRPDDKTAREQNMAAGDVLHLVLALRGGR